MKKLNVAGFILTIILLGIIIVQLNIVHQDLKIVSQYYQFELRKNDPEFNKEADERFDEGKEKAWLEFEAQQNDHPGEE
jgi:hypothetical protein